MQAAPAGKLALSGTIAYAGPVSGVAVFVSVKDPGRPGPPLAALKLPPGPFPLAFSLTEANLMQMGGAPPAIPETVALVVTLDSDGDAMTKAPGDPKAMVQTASVASDLTVTLAPAQP